MGVKMKKKIAKIKRNPGELPMLFIPSYHRPTNLKTVDLFVNKYGYPPSKITVFIDDQGGDEEEYSSTCKKYGVGLQVFDLEDARREYDFVHRPSESRRAAGLSRNQFWKFAVERGIDQYVVLDDDTQQIRYRPYGVCLSRGEKATPQQFWNFVCELADFQRAHRIGLVGLSQSGEMFGSLAHPEFRLWRKKVMNFSFYLTAVVHGGERGVQDDDTLQFLGAMNNGLWCGSLASGIVINQAASATQPGGLTDLYHEAKLLNKALIAPIAYPSAVRAEKQKMNGGRLHHRINYRYIMPCLIKVKSGEGSNIAWDTYPEDVPFTSRPTKRKWFYVE